MRVHVTKIDIANGKARESDCCPLALAMSRAARQPVFVGETVWRFKDGPYKDLPPKAVEFVKEFDRNWVGGKPFQFEVKYDT